MVNAEQIDAMTTGETLDANGYKIVAAEQKNGKRKFMVFGKIYGMQFCNEPKTGKQVLALIAFNKKRGL